ncbi:MAG TPA: signal peptide peptidase SppA [Myxococcota bacterium]|nr:signal peptide peptidase SppA [Myxococcota bacterium]
MRRSLIALVVLAVVVMIGLAVWSARHHLPDHSVLVLELEGDLEEAPPRDLISQLTARGPALPTILLLLDMVAADTRVDGVLVHIKALRIGYARLQELRDALSKLRSSGKRVVALVDETSLNGTRELFLASAANRVLVDPGTLAPLGGVAGQFLHLAGMLEKLGVRVEYSRVGEYKSAVEQFAARQMSPKARENADALIDGVFAQLVDGIASGRALSGEKVRALFQSVPGTPQELVDAGLADAIAGRKEALEKGDFPGGKEVEADAYQRTDASSLGLRKGPRIALVFGDGTIVDERSRSVQKLFTADETEQALDAAAKDDEIKAVVFRVNSPGGGTQASDRIWRAVKRVRDKKPIVVSMADAAASGGYYVASAATAIVAEPATFTGSIGVFMLRPNFAGSLDKLDVGHETIGRGSYASMLTGDAPMTPEQRERTDAFTRSAYTDFLKRVNAGRGTPTEEIDKLGGGHVWLGSEALANHLVDELGGLGTAVERARKEAKIDGEPDPVRVILPVSPGAVEQIKGLLRGESNERLLGSLLPLDLGSLAPLAWLLPGESGLAYLPPYWVELR